MYGTSEEIVEARDNDPTFVLIEVSENELSWYLERDLVFKYGLPPGIHNPDYSEVQSRATGFFNRFGLDRLRILSGNFVEDEIVQYLEENQFSMEKSETIGDFSVYSADVDVRDVALSETHLMFGHRDDLVESIDAGYGRVERSFSANEDVSWLRDSVDGGIIRFGGYGDAMSEVDTPFYEDLPYPSLDSLFALDGFHLGIEPKEDHWECEFYAIVDDGPSEQYFIDKVAPEASTHEIDIDGSRVEATFIWDFL